MLASPCLISYESLLVGAQYSATSRFRQRHRGHKSALVLEKKNSGFRPLQNRKRPNSSILKNVSGIYRLERLMDGLKMRIWAKSTSYSTALGMAAVAGISWRHPYWRPDIR